jgi:hypothetical protein
MVVRASNLERNIPERHANALDLISERAHVACATTYVQVKATHVTRHRCQSALIVELPGKGISFPEIPIDPSPFHQREQSISKVKSKIDRLLNGLASLG